MKNTFLLLLFSCFCYNSYACICSEYYWGIGNLEIGDLDKYDMVAHVKIESEHLVPSTKKRDYSPNSLQIKIKELFKGDAISEVLDYSYFTSCDIGIRTGEEWLLFLYFDKSDGQYYVSACDRNYAIRNKIGTRDRSYNSELNELRAYFGKKIDIPKDGQHQVFYDNGQLEIDEFLVHGKLEGKKQHWFQNGQLWYEANYKNDTLDGSYTKYTPSGLLLEEKTYDMGTLRGLALIYYDTSYYTEVDQACLWELPWGNPSFDMRTFNLDSFIQVCHRIQLKEETFYKENGQVLYSKKYDRTGNPKHKPKRRDDEDTLDLIKD